MSINNTEQLPSGFSNLADWSNWAIADERQRRKKCETSSMEEIRQFYDVMLASMDKIIAHLNRFPLDDMPDAEKNLLYMAFSFIEASISIEMLEEPEMSFGMSMDRFKPVHQFIP